MPKKHKILENIALANKQKNIGGVGIHFDAAGRFNATLAGKEAMVYQIMKYVPCKLLEVDPAAPVARVANAQQEAKKDPPAKEKKIFPVVLSSGRGLVVSTKEAAQVIEGIDKAHAAPTIEVDPLAPTKPPPPPKLPEAPAPVVSEGALVVPEDPAPEAPAAEVESTPEAPAAPEAPAVEDGAEQRGGLPEIDGDGDIEMEDLI